MPYKIITPQLVERCKKDDTLAKLAITLPSTDKPTEKRPQDMAVHVAFFDTYPSFKAIGEAIRQHFQEFNSIRLKQPLRKNFN